MGVALRFSEGGVVVKRPLILLVILMLSVFGGAKTVSNGNAASYQTNSGHENVRVAILLPLSGPNAGLGQAMLNAAQLP